jgi:hypothetical protein
MISKSNLNDSKKEDFKIMLQKLIQDCDSKTGLQQPNQPTQGKDFNTIPWDLYYKKIAAVIVAVW